MSEQEYYKQLVEKFQKLGFKGSEIYKLADAALAQWKTSQNKDRHIATQHIPEVTITAPRITSTVVDNSEKAQLHSGFDTDLSPKDKAALAKGVTYDAKEAAPLEKDALRATINTIDQVLNSLYKDDFTLLRFLLTHSKLDLVNALNLIAKNNTALQNLLMYAKRGGTLNYLNYIKH